MTVALQEIYDRLLAAFGPQAWWPAESPFEVMVGAILTQNTSWRNVERAIEQLRTHDCLSPQGIHSLAVDELAELIRSAGYFRVKARRLKNLVSYLFEHHAGSLESFFSVSLPRLRQELLQINGIGPETADSILLYAGHLPSFVVDNYTARVLKRHGWADPAAGYHELQSLFHAELPAEPQLFNEFHALVVQLGKEFCRPRARCEGCPLVCYLPAQGPYEAE